MAQYIDKDALVAEIEKLKSEALQKKEQCKSKGLSKIAYQIGAYNKVLSLLDTIEVKETMSIAYVVTRSEEHSDYVEKVFFDEDKAQEYCDQFKGNEDEYARDMTRVKVTL